MSKRPTRRVDRRDIRPGDVIRWGQGGRWALVTQIRRSVIGLDWRLMWVFGHDAGHWVPTEPGTVEGWVDPRCNRHSLATALAVVAKHREDARGLWKQLRWDDPRPTTDNEHAAALLRKLADLIDRGDMIKWEIDVNRAADSVQTTIKTWTLSEVRP